VNFRKALFLDQVGRNGGRRVLLRHVVAFLKRTSGDRNSTVTLADVATGRPLRGQ